MSVIRRHPVITFFLLTYALSWAAIFWQSFFAPQLASPAARHPGTSLDHSPDRGCRLPPAHAYALADEIPGAQLIMIDRLGHVTAPACFPIIAPAVMSHIRA